MRTCVKRERVRAFAGRMILQTEHHHLYVECVVQEHTHYAACGRTQQRSWHLCDFPFFDESERAQLSAFWAFGTPTHIANGESRGECIANARAGSDAEILKLRKRHRAGGWINRTRWAVVRGEECEGCGEEAAHA